MDDTKTAPTPPSEDDVERGRKLIVRALGAVALVYVITMFGTLAFGYSLGFAIAIVRLLLLAGLGALILRGRYNWARWVLIALLLLWSIEWARFLLAGDLMAMVALPTLLASTAVMASRPSRRFIQGSS